jgi:hypothetical protein
MASLQQRAILNGTAKVHFVLVTHLRGTCSAHSGLWLGFIYIVPFFGWSSSTVNTDLCRVSI